MIVADQVCTGDAERIQEPDHHPRLCRQRPVGVLGGLGVAQAEQIGHQAAVPRREARDHLPPDEGRKRAPVQQEERLARAPT
jgi:hypothetical protein